jgi:tRNA (cmo5U34)-methyltransferase
MNDSTAVGERSTPVLVGQAQGSRLTGDPMKTYRKHGDATVIPDSWTFKNKSVADNFDRHVREQLPWYDMATMMVTHFGRHYLPENGRMYDLGASTGNITKNLKTEIDQRKVKATSVDSSSEMGDIWQGVGEFLIGDVREIEFENYDFCVCFLLLMFLPPIQQKLVFNKLLAKLNPGGCLIVFDKVEAGDGYLSTVMHRLTMAGKVSTGVPAAEILKKELSLAGQQRPLPMSFMQFSGAENHNIFRFGEFAGWAIIR